MDSDSGDRVTTIIYVHGISRHQTGFSADWFEALRPHLNQAATTREVLWSHHVNALRKNAKSMSTPIEQARASQLKQQIIAELHARQIANSPGRRTRAAGATGSFGLGASGIDDFVRYMMIEPVRTAILSEFRNVVLPLLNDYHSNIHVISHSWGSVVAYEGLRDFDGEDLTGQVSNLFTVGSPLSLTVVRLNLFGRLTDGRIPAHVNQIVNLNAAGDWIGGAISSQIPVQEEFLELPPTGCKTWPRPWDHVARSAKCAHGSYFNRENYQVNRDIFPRFIN
jgi:hypothetical protein